MKEKRLVPAAAGPAHGRPGTHLSPRNWPAGLRYLTSPEHSLSLTAVELSALRTDPTCPPRATTASRPPPSSLVRIMPVAAPATHPALGQRGLFAARDLPPDAHVIDYMGFVHSAVDADPRSTYDLSLDRDLGIAVDATHMGNEARFINDYRGIRDGPNADFRDRVEAGERRMCVFVLPLGKSGRGKRGIRKGEEICVSYGKGFWRDGQAEHDADLH
ncbi:MAG: hypothetical protein M1832_004443 [Thelocarpon impressellum]|nr:MAG: hypothetical protein M1832_004443 [Thelocarpon impressellum]